jgi:hypothetical protein
MSKVAQLAVAESRNQQRYFTNNMTLEQQKSVLESLIKNPPPAAYIHTIYPELAGWIVDTINGLNRPKSSKKISEYIDALQKDRWPVTGATIVFSKQGYLLDGQHRLLACKISGIPIRTFVVFGIDAGAFTMIDIGRKRTNMDAFHIEHVPNARVAAKAIRWLYILSTDPLDRGVQITNDDAIGIYRDDSKINRKTFDECVEKAIVIEKETKLRGRSIPSGSMAALLYLFSLKSQKDADAFARLFIQNKGAAKPVMNRIAAVMNNSGGRIKETFRNKMVVIAWNAFRKGKNCTLAMLDKASEAEDFPEIN